MDKLATLTHEDFRPRLKQAFSLDLREQALGLQLDEVRRLREGYREGAREQFSLLFKGPAAPVLPQGTYRLNHGEMGALDLFLVPVGREAGMNQDPNSGVLYEAVFT